MSDDWGYTPGHEPKGHHGVGQASDGRMEESKIIRIKVTHSQREQLRWIIDWVDDGDDLLIEFPLGEEPKWKYIRGALVEREDEG